MKILFAPFLDHNTELKAFNAHSLDPVVILYRQHGYYYNKNACDSIKHAKPNAVVITDDETVLYWADYKDDIHNYDVEVLLDEDLEESKHDFTPLTEIYPNIRPVNDLCRMFQNSVLVDAWNEYWKDHA